MRVLVIGGTGFMGPHVIARLHGLGHEVTVFHRGRTEAPLPVGVRHVHAVSPDLPILAYPDELRAPAPDVVLHMILLGERDAAATMAAFGGVARRIVAPSSVDVYRAFNRFVRKEPGPPDPVPITEESPLRDRRYPYRGQPLPTHLESRAWTDDYDKILVERAVLGEPRLPGTILRLPMVYGPRDRQHRTFPYLKRMDDGRSAIPLPAGLSRWRGPRGYVENVAAAIALAVADDRAAGRIYNVADEPALDEGDWVRAIGRAAGWEGEVVAIPDDRLPEELRRPLDTAQDCLLDTGRIRRELGWSEPVPRDEALRRTIAWERANPPETVDPALFDYAAEDDTLRRPR